MNDNHSTDRRISVMCRSVVRLSFPLMALTAGAESVLPTGWETNVSVTAGASSTLTGPLRMSSASDGVLKTGDGTWTLPLGSVWTRGDLSVDVHGGTLELTADGSIPAAAHDSPPAILENAAIWLEAGTNTVQWSKNAERVERWYDVRETKDASDNWGSNRFRMYAMPAKDSNGVENAVTNFPELAQIETVSGTRPMMFFHGAQSGSWMEYRNAGGTASACSKIRHVFVAVNLDTAYGYVLGVQKGGTPFLHPQQHNGSMSGRYANFLSGSDAFACSRFYLNGQLIEPDQVTSRKGLQVMEVECSDMAFGSVGTLFNDRNVANRYGGDYVGELVIFTNRLTEAQRHEVGEYMLRKWVSEPRPSSVSVRLAEGTTLRGSDAAVSFAGAGSLLLDGGGKWLQTGGCPFSGSVLSTADAAVDVVQAGELPYALAAGDVVTATLDGYDAATLSRATNAADAASGTVSCTGAQPLRVGSLEGVKFATVETGELILGRRSNGPAVLSTEVYATIADGDGDFEKFSPHYPGAGSGGSTTAYGWTLRSLSTSRQDSSTVVVGKVVTFDGALAMDNAPGGNAWYLGFNETSTINSYQKDFFYPPKGKSIVVIKAAGEISADVDVPETGDYEFSYHGTGRVKYDYGEVTLSLVDETVSPAVTNTFARYLQPAGYGWRKYRYLLRNVEAGTYRLYVRMMGKRYPDSDSHAAFDDFEMRLVPPAGKVVMTAEPPNASFEVVDCPYAYRASYSWHLAAPGWTLVLGDVGNSIKGSTDSARDCEVAFVMRQQGGWYNPDCRYGQTQLRLRSTGGYAQTDPFTLPAGTWRLRYLGSRWTFTDHGTYKWKGSMNPSVAPVLSASVFLNGSELSLGSSEVRRMRLFSDHALPGTFTVTASDSVELRLWQSAANTSSTVADMTVDSVYFERVDTVSSGGELVRNGSFELDNSDWTFKRNNDGHTAATDSRYYSDCSRHQVGSNATYGYTRCDGATALLIAQIGQATQPITFSESGMYRLGFWTRARYFTGDDGKVDSTYYGGNQIRTWLADEDGVTNELHRTTSVFSTNFLEHTVLFRVDRPGAYTFGIQGCNDYPDNVTAAAGSEQNNSIALVDCVSIVRSEEDTMPELEPDLQLVLGAGSRLRLDYAGTNSIKRLKLGGKSVSGLIDASHVSGLVYGPGALYVQPKGLSLVFR